MMQKLLLQWIFFSNTVHLPFPTKSMKNLHHPTPSRHHLTSYLMPLWRWMRWRRRNRFVGLLAAWSHREEKDRKPFTENSAHFTHKKNADHRPATNAPAKKSPRPRNLNFSWKPDTTNHQGGNILGDRCFRKAPLKPWRNLLLRYLWQMASRGELSHKMEYVNRESCILYVHKLYKKVQLP